MFLNLKHQEAPAPEPEFSPIESNGSVILGEDVADKLYANEFSIHDPIGKHIPQATTTDGKLLQSNH